MKSAKRPYDNSARAAKALETRSRILAVAGDLYAEAAMEDVTLDEVATRAGTSVQTILRAFSSKDELMIAALYQRGRSSPSPVRASTPGDVPDALSVIFDLYESIGDSAIRHLADAVRIPALRPGLAEGRRAHRQWVQTVFAPQLAASADPDRLFNALVAATDVYVWHILRRDQDLGRATAQSILSVLVTAVLKQG